MSKVDSTTAPAVCFREIKPGYRIGDDGSVWSSLTKGRNQKTGDLWRKLRPTPMASGHMHVELRRGDDRYVHTLVLEAFVGPCPSGQECRHLDGDPGNNRLSNLKWGTRRENSADRIGHGRSGRGEESPVAKLSEADVREILAMRQGGMRIGDIARWFETSRPNVEAILYGRSWNHVTGIPLPIVKPPSERRPKNKLTSGQVREILALIASGITKKDIAIRMGVSEGTILKIDQGKTWRPFLARIAKENPESETGENSV
jgi:hypothetical protein